ncbi:hypothetical protein HDU67_002615 [Dinochytrium kinnereticum]|nr:hypothetical protein HDU67_002615 [Dinochytrium kinnereticum]
MKLLQHPRPWLLLTLRNGIRRVSTTVAEHASKPRSGGGSARFRTARLVQGDEVSRRTLMATRTLMVVVQVLMACSLLNSRRKLEVEAAKHMASLASPDSAIGVDDEGKAAIDVVSTVGNAPGDWMVELRRLLKHTEDTEEIWRLCSWIFSNDEAKSLLVRSDLLSVIATLVKQDAKSTSSRCITIFKFMSDRGWHPTMDEYQQTLTSFQGDTRFINCLSLIRFMRSTNLTPSYAALESLLMSFCQDADARKSMAMLKVLSVFGYKPSTKALTTVLSMLTGKNNFEAAERAITLSLQGNVNADAIEVLVTQYLGKNDVSSALRHFRSILQNGGKASPFVANHLLQHLVSQENQQDALACVDLVLKAGITLSPASSPSPEPPSLSEDLASHQSPDPRFLSFGVQLLKQYAKLNADKPMLRDAIVFTATGLPTWGSDKYLFDAIVMKILDETDHLGFQKVARQIRHLNLQLHPWTYGRLLWRLARRGDHYTVLQFHRYLHRTQTQMSRMAFNAILYSYVHSRNVKEVLKVIRDPFHSHCVDAKSYATVVSFLFRQRRSDQAFDLIREMGWKGVKPNAALLTDIAENLLKHDDLEGAVAVCSAMLREGKGREGVAAQDLRHQAIRILAKAYGTLKDGEDIRTALSNLSITYDQSLTLRMLNGLLSTQGKSSTLSSLKPIYNLLLDLQLRPDLHTFSSLLTPIVRDKDLPGIRLLLAEMDDQNVKPNHVIMCQLVKFFLNTNDRDGLIRLWEFFVKGGGEWDPPMGLVGPMLSLVDVGDAVKVFRGLEKRGCAFDNEFRDRFWKSVKRRRREGDLRRVNSGSRRDSLRSGGFRHAVPWSESLSYPQDFDFENWGGEDQNDLKAERLGYSMPRITHQ